MKKFGACLKARRIEDGWTLREFARAQKLDAGNLSRIERSKVLPFPPLARTLLETYGFQRLGKAWRFAVNAYCRDLVVEARNELVKT